MLLNFQKRFLPWIEDGSKTHTIRARRVAGPPRVGGACHCYTGLRHKGCRLLGRWRCVRVQPVTIIPASGDLSLRIWVDGQELDYREKQLLAWRDGFREMGSSEAKPGRALELMTRFWLEKHFVAGIASFTGDMIHWDRAQPMPKKAKR